MGFEDDFLICIYQSVIKYHILYNVGKHTVTLPKCIFPLQLILNYNKTHKYENKTVGYSKYAKLVGLITIY